MSKSSVDRPQSSTDSIRRLLTAIKPVYFALVALVIISAISEPSFAQLRTARNILVSSTALAIVTVGQTAVMLVAGIDLSVGAVMSLVTAVSALLMESHPEMVGWIVLLCVGIGVLVGLINGILVSYLRMNPLILTLATGTALQGVVLHILYSPGGLVTRGFREVSRGSLGPIPYPVIILLALYLVGSYILKETPYGLSVYAVGGNENSARLSGLRVNRIKLSLFVISGFLASCGGLFLASRIGSGDPLSGDSFTMDSIAAAVLGGTNLFGGIGDLWGGLAGVFIISILSTMLNLNNVSSFYQWVIKGTILIGALAVEFFETRSQ